MGVTKFLAPVLAGEQPIWVELLMDMAFGTAPDVTCQVGEPQLYRQRVLFGRWLVGAALGHRGLGRAYFVRSCSDGTAHMLAESGRRRVLEGGDNTQMPTLLEMYCKRSKLG